MYVPGMPIWKQKNLLPPAKEKKNANQVHKMYKKKIKKTYKSFRAVTLFTLIN